MSDVRVPREAIEAGAAIEFWAAGTPYGGRVSPAAVGEIIEAALRDVRTSGVSFEDPRLDYLEVQIDRQTWDELEAALGSRFVPEEPKDAP